MVAEFTVETRRNKLSDFSGLVFFSMLFFLLTVYFIYLGSIFFIFTIFFDLLAILYIYGRVKRKVERIVFSGDVIRFYKGEFKVRSIDRSLLYKVDVDTYAVYRGKPMIVFYMTDGESFSFLYDGFTRDDLLKIKSHARI